MALLAAIEPPHPGHRRCRQLPESPRWLIGKGRLAEAEQVVAGMERASRSGAAPTPVAIPTAIIQPARPHTWWSELLSPTCPWGKRCRRPR